MKRHTLCTLFAAVALASCATSEKSQITDAATTPLSDLNLVHASIPAVLVAAQKQPYFSPADQGCESLRAEVRGLDEVLGPDLDAPATTTNPSLIERGSATAGDAAVGALRGAAEGIVPFRGWVRKLSGAERYSRDVAAAIAAGTVRRAYLKGLGSARSCPMVVVPATKSAGT